MDDAAQKKWMTVTEMGNLLGLKKTDRYWLVHKNVFETKVLLGQMRVNVASFEKWYANQIKYHKVTGEEPGLELKEWSYSIRDMAELLDVTENNVYDIINREKLETVLVDYWKRVPKTVFWKWYNSQNKYQTREDRESMKELYDTTISMPEMARMLGVKRSVVYFILKNKLYGKLLETVVIGEQKRITKESFQKFLEEQNKYHLDTSQDNEELSKEKNPALADFRRKKIMLSGCQNNIGTLQYLTPEEAAMMANVSRTTVIRWYQQDEFPIIRIGNRIRIKRAEFELWMKEKRRK